MATEISHGLGRHRWSQRRSSTNSWGLLIEMERFKYRAAQEDLGAVALVLLDLAKAFERVNFPLVWAWATHFCFPRKILRVVSISLWFGPGRRTSASQGKSCGCYVGTSSIRGECSSKDVWQSRSRPSLPSCQGPRGVACFGHKMLPSFEVEGLCG